MASKEVENIYELPAEVSPLDSWETLTEGAHTTTGASLFKGDALAQLVGVPCLITSATFRPGIYDKVSKTQFDYVSVEAMVAPVAELTKALLRGQITAAQADLLTPGETIVINDGSTGIYRQFTKYLSELGAIKLPSGDAEGEKGASRFDAPRNKWLGSAVEVTVQADGTFADTRFPVRLMCPRGLRASTYPSPVNPAETVTTYYLG